MAIDFAIVRQPASLRRAAFLYIAALLVAVPFALRFDFGRPSTSQGFFYIYAALLGAATYSVARIAGLAPAPPRDATRLWVVLHVFCLAIAAYLSPQPGRALSASLFPLAGAALYMVVFAFPWNRADATRLASMLLLPLYAVSAYGLVQSFGFEILPYNEEFRELGKFSIISVFGQANYFASYLGPLLALTLGLMAWGPAPRRAPVSVAFGAAFVSVAICLGAFETFQRIGFVWLIPFAVVGAAAWAAGWFRWLAAVAAAACILLAGARGMWIALIAMAPIVGIAAWRYGLTRKESDPATGAKRPGHRATIAAVVAVVLIAAAAISPLGKGLAARAAESFTVATRLHHFTIAVQMIRERPWLGWGYGAYASEYFEHVAAFQAQPENRAFANIVADTGAIPPRLAHNILLETAVDAGFPGVFTFLGILASLAFSSLIALGRAAPRGDKILLLTLNAAVAILFIDGLFGFPLHLPSSAALFWAFLAMGSRIAGNVLWPAAVRSEIASD